MWRKQSKGIFSKQNRKLIYLLAGLLLGGLLLIGCGAASTSTGTSSLSNNGSAAAPSSANQSNGTTNNTKGNGNTAQYGPQYLVKSLQVTLEVKDTQQAANGLEQWIYQTDTQATSDGTNYQQIGNNQYDVTLTFLVDVSHYDQIETYLRNYAGQQGGTLVSLQESVQDVTNDYVDSESTLTNLRAEQQRLLDFMNQAQNVNDAVNIEQQLAQVESQINDIEAHLNALKGQTTFYTVTITLQPLGSVPPPPVASPWSIIPIWQGAWAAVIVVSEALAAILAWLLAFSVYIIPAGIVIWLIRKRPWRRSPLLATPAAAPLPASAPTGRPRESEME